MTGNRIFADGVKKQHSSGPRACSIQIADDVLVVRASSSQEPSASWGSEETLASLPLSLLLHPRDPLLFVQLNSHSVVFHRKSDAGHDGLLLLFENPSGLEAFVHALEQYLALAKDAVGSSSPESRKKRGSVASSTARKSPPRRGDDARRQFTPKRGLPSFVKTPASSPAASNLFVSPSPVAHSDLSTAARRNVHFDSASPHHYFFGHGFNEEKSIHVSSPVASTQTDPLPAASLEFAQDAPSARTPSGTNPLRSSGHHQTASDIGMDDLYSLPHQRLASPGVYSHRTDSNAYRAASNARVPSASYASSTAPTGSSSRKSQVDAYMDRSGRVQHYMDALEEASQRRAALLEDLFEERDRKRRAQLRKMEHQEADDEIRASVKERFRNGGGHHHHHLHHLDQDARFEQQQANNAEDPLLFRLKQLLRETPAASASPSVPRFGSVSPTPVINNPNPLHSEHSAGEGQFLVEQIKQLLADEYDGFEELRMHATTMSLAASADNAAPTGVHFNDYRSSSSHKPLSPAPAATVAPFVLGKDLNDAVAAEARLVSSLRYGQIPMPKARHVPEASNRPLDGSSQLPKKDDDSCASPTVLSPQSARQETPAAVEASPRSEYRTPTSSKPSPSNVASTLHLDAPPVVARRADGSEAAPTATKEALGPQSPTATSGHTAVDTASHCMPVASAWKELVDKTTGRPYYVDKTSKKTTWNRADTDLDEAAMVVEAKQSQLQPKAVSSVPDGTPGPDWVTKQDKATGKPYYIHKETKRTTWKLSDTQTGSASAEQGTAFGASQVADAQKQTTTSTPSSTQASTVSASSPPPQSASGWIARADPNTGKTFYSNAKLRKTTWNIADTDLITATKPVAKGDATLPPSWKAVPDKATGKTYYVHIETKKTQWTFPKDE